MTPFVAAFMSTMQKVALISVCVSILTSIATIYVLAVYYAGEEDEE